MPRRERAPQQCENAPEEWRASPSIGADRRSCVDAGRDRHASFEGVSSGGAVSSAAGPWEREGTRNSCLARDKRGQRTNPSPQRGGKSTSDEHRPLKRARVESLVSGGADSPDCRRGPEWFPARDAPGRVRLPRASHGGAGRCPGRQGRSVRPPAGRGGLQVRERGDREGQGGGEPKTPRRRQGGLERRSGHRRGGGAEGGAPSRHRRTLAVALEGPGPPDAPADLLLLQGRDHDLRRCDETRGPQELLRRWGPQCNSRATG